MGPATEPWGTEKVTGLSADMLPSMEMLKLCGTR